MGDHVPASVPYRSSSYTVVMPIIRADNETDKKNALLFNGLYMAYDIVPVNVANAFLNGNFNFQKSVTDRLLRRGHLTLLTQEEELDDLKFLTKLKRLADKQLFYAEIVPTYDCNFRCPYCFERARLKNGEEWLSKTISSDILNAYFGMLKKYQERGIKVCKLNLYGGEPLLKKNYALIEDICHRCKESDIPIEAISNGYNIDYYIDLIDKYHWNDIQISLDGYGDLTDSFRRHIDGYPTYEHIMQNVKLLYDHSIKTTVRIMTDRGRLSGLKQIVKDFRDRGLAEKPGSFGYYITSVISSDSEIMVSPIEIFDELVSIGMTQTEARSHVIQLRRAWNTVLNNMKKNRLPPIFPYRCRAHNSQRLSVDPFGRVYTCFRVFSDADSSVGIIDTEKSKFVPNTDSFLWDIRDVSTLRKCRICPYSMLCSGGCAERAKANNGSYFKENCGQTYEIYSYAFPRVVGETWFDGMDEELSLTWAEPLSKITSEEKKRFIKSVSISEQQMIIKDMNLKTKFVF